MTRIKYNKVTTTDGLTLVSKKPIIAGLQAIVITLETYSLNLVISKWEGGEVLVRDTAPTLAALKKKAKEHAKVLGAVFSDEVRQRSTTLPTTDVDFQSHIDNT